ncbi:hypothetical protein HYZ82_00815 [Candidatus Nomurabacteria bacterium]|nr:hypothetical protein [Candidatus Nomurabacteria bacterium]
MEQNFQTSFIPKKPVIEQRVTPVRSVSALTIISLFILFAVLLGTGGLYFYKVSLEKSIVQMENDLNLARDRFEPSKITELQTLDKRLRDSTEILSKHTAATPIFQALSDITMQTVRYTKFAYETAEGKSGEGSKVGIKMSGIAVGYRSVALQSDLFAKNKNFISPIFSNLTLDPSGNVQFDLEFSVDPAFVNYKKAFLAEN